jgi:hypothetical protein
MSAPPDRASYLRARVAALLDEFPDAGPELCDALIDLFDEAIDEVATDIIREHSLAA